MEQFLASVEKKAFRMAEISTQNADDALDIVQDTMMKLVQKYAHKPPEEWAPLFYRILQSRITDFHRKRKRQTSWLGWAVKDEVHNGPDGYLDNIKGQQQYHPDHIFDQHQENNRITAGLKQLPPRQQQVFLLRAWEGLNVKETALVMKCSEGSVKTHYSRALKRLKMILSVTERVAL